MMHRRGSMGKQAASIWVVLIVGLASGPSGAQGETSGGQAAEIERVEVLLDEALEAIAAVDSYSGRLVKRERIGKKLKTEEMVFKFARPFKVYVRMIEPNEGREAIYIDGWNNNKVRAHLGRFPDVTANIDPRGRRAMKDNHHPITSFGLENMLEITAENIRKAIQRCEGTFQVSERTLLGQPVWQIDVTFAEGGRHVAVQEGETLWDVADRVGQNMYVIMHHTPRISSPTDVDAGDRVFVPCHYAARGEYYISKQTAMLVKASSWDHQGELFESYEYPELDLEPGLTDRDFDPENKAYDF